MLGFTNGAMRPGTEPNEGSDPPHEASGTQSGAFSIEMSPKEAIRGVRGIERLPRSTRTFIPRLPKGSFEETLAAAVCLHERGLRPVPHVTARTTPNAAVLASRIARFVREAGVQEILLVAGSNERPEGTFSDTTEILGSRVLESSGLRALSVAGHPEGHPQAGEEDLQRALEVKNAFAVRTGLPITLITQFFFDAAPVIAWEARIRARGNMLPIDAGIHGVTGVMSLMKYALACGVGASIKALGANSGSLLQFAQLRSPEGIVRSLAAAKAADPRSLLRRFHFFPLGGFERTVDFAIALEPGREASRAAPPRIDRFGGET